jgi:signal transduction histidine kinase/DNA-binding response OmpR family regulator
MAGKRLLVIEDDIDSLDAVSDVLRDAGHEVLTAATGRDGLKILHGGTALDLVLLDFWLPDMTGHAFLATRTRWPGALSLPVLLVTGDDAWVDEHRDLRQLGVVGILRKPFEPQQVLSAVEHATSADASSVARASSTVRPPEAVTAVAPSVARQARRLSDLLVRASELLAQSVDITAHLRDVTRLVVPSLADFCVIEQAESGPHQRRLLCSAHANPAHDTQLRQLAERPEGLSRAVTEVLDTGRPQLHERVSDDALQALAHTPADAEALKVLGFDSVIITPMIARQRVFGAMTWGSLASQRLYGRAHLETAADLAHRIALALDNDQLFRSAQEALRAREELVALISHDLRTPLSAITVTATHALQSAASQAESASASSILRNARRMERLIRDLLDFSQLEAGSLRVELREESLPALLRHAVETSQSLAGKNVLSLELDEAARELAVMCDRERIIQVLNNLIGAAVRSTPAQGRINVRLSVLDGEPCVTVTDSGEGVSEQEMPNLFDGFRKTSGSSPEAARGAGLGLYIARGLIEAHGGRMWMQSEPGPGSTVYFTLRPSMQPVARSGDPALRIILLVDDDVVFRRELQEILRERGYSVETADNGWQAWSYLQVNPPPALILLDLMMPVMDGWELHAAIKSHPVLAAVPTVIVSCLDRYRIELSLADAQGYIEKPIRTAQLFDVVQRHVSAPTLLRAHSTRPALIG